MEILEDHTFEFLSEKKRLKLILSDLYKKKVLSRTKYEMISNSLKNDIRYKKEILMKLYPINPKIKSLYEKEMIEIIKNSHNLKETENILEWESSSSQLTYNFDNIVINDSGSSRESSPVGDFLLKSKIYSEILHKREPLQKFAFLLKKID
jgi:hypothetical protein